MFKKKITVFLILLVAGVLAITDTAMVQAVDRQFFSGNDILFYGDDEACGTGGGASAGEVSQLRGDNNAEKIYNFWLDVGLSSAQSAGVTGSIKHESGFSAFRQEMSKSWPGGGWGIAQFTHSPGQRQSATDYVRNVVGEEVFAQYYKNDFGGPVTETTGFVPDGVPSDINNSFLLAELNYLRGHIQELTYESPEYMSIRAAEYNAFDGKFGPGDNLFDHLKSIETPAMAAAAWTFLYEYPDKIIETSKDRGATADEIFALYGDGSSTSELCGGGLADGGMTLDEAKEFMSTYKMIDKGDPNGDSQYIVGAHTCDTGTDNCVAFSEYFIRKYSTAAVSGAPGNGIDVVARLAAENPGKDISKTPTAYSVFSRKSGGGDCDERPDVFAPCGHTGIILGIDVANNKIITGEASWCDDSYTGAYEYSLSEWADSDDYEFFDLSSLIKSEHKGGLK